MLSYSYVHAFLSGIKIIWKKTNHFFSSDGAFCKVSSQKTRSFGSFASNLVLRKVTTPKIGLSDDT